jgi:putative transposase
MIKVERHFHKGSEEIVRLCSLSKELYNRCNYFMRQAWFSRKRLPDINILINETRNLECFKQLHNTKTAKQTVRRVLEDWSNFRKALVAYGRDSSKFICCPKPPGYKDKMAQVIFYQETIKRGKSKKPISMLTPTNGCFSVPFCEGYKQVVITPKAFGFIIEVQYKPKDKEERSGSSPKLDKGKVCTIDIGLNNLCAITLGQRQPILVNGRIVKSINQWYNKRQCKSRLRKRYFRLENYFHHVSKMIVDLCLKEGIGRIVIGRNCGWKNGMHLGKVTDQNFCFVPFYLLLQKIKYKATVAGIIVTFTEEAYTSKSSFYDRDPLPVYEHNVEPPLFSGKRKHRGLYVTKDGFAVNADVNGSMNIGRKVIPEFLGIGDRSLAARPVVVNPLKAGW